MFAEVVKDANSASRKELEMNSLYSLLSCRIVEMNVPLKNNKQAFLGPVHYPIMPPNFELHIFPHTRVTLASTVYTI